MRMMKHGRTSAFLLAVIMVLAFLVSPASVMAGVEFSDVSPSDWFHPYVTNLSGRGIVSGYPGTTEFRPRNQVTREHAAKMIAGAAGLDIAGKTTDFADNSAINSELVPYVGALVDKGAIAGFPDGTFRPRSNILRSHVSKIVALAFDLKDGDLEVNFSDLPEDQELKDAITTLASNGIVTGYNGTDEFRPRNEVTRAELSKILSVAMAVSAVQIAETEKTNEAIDHAQGFVDSLPDSHDPETKQALQARLDAIVVPEEPEEPDVFDKIKLTVTSKDTTVSVAVDSEYEVKAVIPKGAYVSAREALLRLEMTDVASLGIEGTRSHELLVQTGVGPTNVELDTFIADLLDLTEVTFNGLFGDKAVVYTLERQDTDDDNIWLISPDSVGNARAAWMYLADAVEVETYAVDDSQIYVPAGSYLIIGDKMLLFETDLLLENVTGDLDATEQAIREAVVLVDAVDPEKQVEFYLEAGARLRIGQSEAIMKTNLLATLDGLNLTEDELNGILPDMQDATGVQGMILGALDFLNLVSEGMQGQVIDVNVQLDVELPEEPEEPEEPEAFDKIKLTVTSKDTTVSVAVDNYYEVKAVIPKGAYVSAREALLRLEMTDVASLGIEGTRSHELLVQTGVGPTNVELDTFIAGLLDLTDVTFNGLFGDKAVVYTLERQDTEDDNIWLISPDSVDNARAAWLYLAGAVEVETYAVDDSQIYVPAGSYLIVGDKMLLFETDLLLENVTGDLDATEQAIREAVVLVDAVDPAKQVEFYLEAGAKLRIGQSEAIMKTNLLATLDGLNLTEADLNGILPDMQDATGVQGMILGALDFLNLVSEGMQGQVIDIELTLDVVTPYGIDAQLALAVANASLLIEEDYSEESWLPFSQALAHAIGVLADPGSRYNDYYNALITLLNAQDSLTVDRTGLGLLLDYAVTLEEEDYSNQSWTFFFNAYLSALDTNNNPLATQKAIDDAKADLENAISLLTVDRTLLHLALQEAEQLDSEHYSEDSWTVFYHVFLEAQGVYHNEDATQREIDQALEDLQTALAELNELPLHTVTFLDQDETLLGSVKVIHGRSAEAYAPQPTPAAGYLFAGWSAPIDIITEPLTVYAVYLLDPAIQEVIDAIEALPLLEQIHLGHAEDVREVQDLYDALTPAFQALVDNADDLFAALNHLALIEAKLAEMTGLIEAAIENKYSVVISTDGHDLYDFDQWVTQEEYDAYAQAISSASAIQNKNDVSLAEAEGAIADLNSATGEFNQAKKQGLLVLQATFDLLYFYDKWASVGSGPSTVWYRGVEELVVGAYSVFLDKDKVAGLFGPLQPGDQLKMDLGGQFLKASDLSEAFVEEPDYFILSSVQEANNPGVTITPATLGQLDGSQATHAAVIYLVKADQGAVNQVMAMIGALPDPDHVSVEDKDDVVAARMAYQALSDAEKTAIHQESLQKLEALENKLPRYVTAIRPLADRTLNSGTTWSNLVLRMPRKVRVELDYFREADLLVSWINPGEHASGDGPEDGALVMAGSLIMEEGIENPLDLGATVQVTLEDLDHDQTYAGLWEDFEATVNQQAAQSDPPNRVLISLDMPNLFVNVKIRDDYHYKKALATLQGSGVKTAVLDMMLSDEVVSLKSQGILFHTLDEDGNKRPVQDLEDDAWNLGLGWAGTNYNKRLIEYLIYETIELTIIGHDGHEVSCWLYFY